MDPHHHQHHHHAYHPPHPQHPQHHYAAHPHPQHYPAHAHPHHAHHGLAQQLPAAPPQVFSRKRSMSNDSEDQTWHSFKRLRLQTSDESSYHSSSGDDSVYNNHHRSHPRHIAYQHHNNLQHAGQPTASSESFYNAPPNNTTVAEQEDYSKVNHFLGLLHQQRKQRIQQQEGATATSELWQQPQPPMHMPHPQSYHHNPLPKQQRRHAVRLPSDSKLL